MSNSLQIVIPTDYSNCAKNASSFGISLFKEIPAAYHLVHATDIVVPMPDGIFVQETADQKVDFDQMNAEKEWFLEQINPENTLVDSEVITGPVNGVINTVVEKVNPDLVIMGTHGMTSSQDLFLGSNTSSYLANTDVPVLTVPSHYKYKPMKRVLMATDLSEIDNMDNLSSIFEVLQIEGASLEILKVYEKDEEGETFEEQYQKLKLDDYFNSVVHEFNHAWNEDIESTILERLEQGEFDMLVVFPRHKSILNGLFHKSITKKIALKSWVPTMFIDPTKN